MRDRLLMFDLGYFRYQLFDRIDRNGGFFQGSIAVGMRVTGHPSQFLTFASFVVSAAEPVVKIQRLNMKVTGIDTATAAIGPNAAGTPRPSTTPTTTATLRTY